jgi:hypothetical protein
MKKTLLLFLTLFLLSACSSKVNVTTDYDPNVPMNGFKTFAIVPFPDKTPESLDHERYVKAIRLSFSLKGYKEADEKYADMLIRYQHEIIKDKPGNLKIGFGLGSFSGGSGVAMGTSAQPRYDEGTLIIDILKPSTGKIVWRGRADGRVSSYEDPKEREAEITRFVAAVVKSFPQRESK